MGVFKLALALASLPSALAAAVMAAGAQQKAPEEEMKYTFHIEDLKEIDTTNMGLPDFVSKKLGELHLQAAVKRVWCEMTEYEDDAKTIKMKPLETDAEFDDVSGVWSVNAKMCERAFVTFKNKGVEFVYEIGILKGHVVAGNDKGDLSKLMFIGVVSASSGAFPLYSQVTNVGSNVFIEESSVTKLKVELETQKDGQMQLEAIKVTNVKKEDQDDSKPTGSNHYSFHVGSTTTVLKIGNFRFEIEIDAVNVPVNDPVNVVYIKKFGFVDAMKRQYAKIEGISIYNKCVGFSRAANFASLGKSGFWTMWYLVPIVLVLVVAAGAVAWFLGLIGGGSKPEESEDLSSRLSSSSVEGGEIELEASS